MGWTTGAATGFIMCSSAGVDAVSLLQGFSFGKGGSSSCWGTACGASCGGCERGIVAPAMTVGVSWPLDSEMGEPVCWA